MSLAERTVLVVTTSEWSEHDYGQQLQQDCNITYRILTERLSAPILPTTLLHQVDGILLDLHPLQYGSFDLLGQLKQNLGDSGPPIVVIDNGEAERAVRALKSGAVDYLVKERMTTEDLQAAMRNAIANAELQRQLQRSQEQFRVSVENMLDCFGIFSAIRDASGQTLDFRIDYLNAAACENNRLLKEDQIGRGLCELLPAHRSSGLFDEYCQVVETGVPLIKDSLIYDDTYGEEQLVRAFDIRATKLNDGFVASWRDITERKHLELKLSQTAADLRQQQQRLQRLIDTAPIGIGIGRANGEVKVINDEMLRLHGYTRAEFEQQGMDWRPFTPPEFADRMEPAMQQLQQHGFLPPEEKELCHRDGTRVPIWISATQWLDGVDEHVAFAVDLTAQKQAEANLKASQQRYRELAEAMPQMVWTADATGAINYWNQRWYEYTGLSEAESLGLAGVNTVHPQERDRTLERWAQAVGRGESFEIEYRIRRWDGIYRWFISRGIPTCNFQEKVTGWIGTITDIEEQKQLEARLVQDIVERQQSEQALQFNEERFRLVTRAVNGLVFDWNLQTGELYRSEQLFNLIGVRPEDAPPTASWWHERIHPDDHTRLAALVPQIYASDQDLYEGEYRVRHEDGHWVDVWERACLIRDAQGQVLRIVGSTLDISDRKLAEQERERLLTQEQTAREEAERANRMKDEFLAVLSHELRSPLNPILGWARLLQNRRFDAAKITEALATIERNARLQAQLIDDLLDVARILRGKLALNQVPLNLSTVIEAAMETVRGAALTKSITIQSQLLDIGQVLGDTARLQQVVWNLLSNAVKFTPDGGQVTVQLQQRDHQAEIIVRDTGKGINSDFLPYLFETFRQEDTSTTRKYGGLGLGLAIVRQLVEAHGGTITADSSGEGLGATFIVRLPLLPVRFETNPTTPQTFEPDLTLAGLHILVVDDEPDNRSLTAMLLTQYGATVTDVDSAAAALSFLDTTLPDLIISDIGMPEVDGYGLMRQIRARTTSQGGQIPAIALTAYAREEDQQRALQSGYQRRVTKPLNPELLAQTVLDLISHQPPSDSWQ